MVPIIVTARVFEGSRGVAAPDPAKPGASHVTPTNELGEAPRKWDYPLTVLPYTSLRIGLCIFNYLCGVVLSRTNTSWRLSLMQ